jgi:anti-sigma factor RsiW
MSTSDPPDELLSAYLDGEVTDEEQSTVADALARSADCRATLAELAAARDAVRGLDAPEVPAGFLAGIERAVAIGHTAQAAQAAPTASGADRSRSRRGLVWLAGGAAAAALLAAMVIPSTERVDPAVRARVDAHAARSSVSDDPVSELAPVATATGGLRR